MGKILKPPSKGEEHLRSLRALYYYDNKFYGETGKGYFSPPLGANESFVRAALLGYQRGRALRYRKKRKARMRALLKSGGQL